MRTRRSQLSSMQLKTARPLLQLSGPVTQTAREGAPIAGVNNQHFLRDRWYTARTWMKQRRENDGAGWWRWWRTLTLNRFTLPTCGIRTVARRTPFQPVARQRGILGGHSRSRPLRILGGDAASPTPLHPVTAEPPPLHGFQLLDNSGAHHCSPLPHAPSSHTWHSYGRMN